MMDVAPKELSSITEQPAVLASSSTQVNTSTAPIPASKDVSTQTDETPTKEADETTEVKTTRSYSSASEREELVGDIIYRVEYRNINGLLFKSKDAIEPIEIETVFNTGGRVQVTGTPVLQIVTKVYTPLTSSQTRDYHSRDSSGSDDSDDELVDSLNIASDKETYMIIHSSPLINALRAVVKYYPDQSLLASHSDNEV